VTRRFASRAFVPIVLALAGCRDQPPDASTPGDPDRGRRVLAAHECGVCHEIPGVTGAHGRVGPSLHSFTRHPYVAGKFPNTSEVLVSWIKDAPAMAPLTAMPDLAVDDRDARDMAAYLYTLE
jgi:cytochrome c